MASSCQAAQCTHEEVGKEAMRKRSSEPPPGTPIHPQTAPRTGDSSRGCGGQGRRTGLSSHTTDSSTHRGRQPGLWGQEHRARLSSHETTGVCSEGPWGVPTSLRGWHPAPTHGASWDLSGDWYNRPRPWFCSGGKAGWQLRLTSAPRPPRGCPLTKSHTVGLSPSSAKDRDGPKSRFPTALPGRLPGSVSQRDQAWETKEDVI